MICTNSDGGARGNPGPGAIGVVVRDEKTVLETYSTEIGICTNNIAEYRALLKALELALKYEKEVTCHLDSELVVKQLNGEYKVRNERLMHLFLEVQKLINKFEKVTFVFVKRENEFQCMADVLVNKALDGED
ncbi:ribonuclease H [Candidatus Pacearchaeota archaeon CG10_big_fil_rev_8_21_14_0_10_32_14]|nr:MAG: ribonuclease H [Candidatus Pacearchaeota archaeon CG10_big_fil_rev_8_21_14_0_10_32_14]